VSRWFSKSEDGYYREGDNPDELEEICNRLRDAANEADMYSYADNLESAYRDLKRNYSEVEEQIYDGIVDEENDNYQCYLNSVKEYNDVIESVLDNFRYRGYKFKKSDY
jgi:hypothetical protein